MGSNVPHKGIIKAGRLSPVVFGSFPIKSAMAGLGGDMVHLRLQDGKDITGSSLESAGTASVSSEDILLTSGTSATNVAALASVLKMDIRGRFALECKLRVDSVDNSVAGTFIGFSSSRTAPIADADGVLAILASSLGVFIDRANGDLLQIAVRNDTDVAVLTSTGKALVVDNDYKIGLLGKGDGKVSLFLDDVLLKKVSIAGNIDPAYAVACIVNQSAAARTLKLGPFFAAGVVD